MGLISYLKGFFSKFVQIFKEFIKEALPLAKQIVIGQLKSFALDVVRELEVTDLNKEEKRKQAFTRIKDYAEHRGINAKDSLVNLILELAVQKFRF